MISDLFTTEFTPIRKVWTIVDGIDKTVEEEGNTFMGYRQQASAEYLQSVALTVSRPHIIWCAVDAVVAEGDVLQSDYGFDKVRAKQINRDGDNAHLELLVEFIGFEQTS